MTDLSPSEPYSTPTRVQMDAVPLAVIRHDGVRLDEIEAFYDADYAVLNAAAAAGRIRLAGPPVALYHGDPMGLLDVEIGIPVETTVDRYPDFVASELPAGMVSVLTHVGSYANLGASWAALVGAEQGDATSEWAEVYVTEPGLVAAERLRTDLYLYVER